MPIYVGTSRAAEILEMKRDSVSDLCRKGKFETAEHDGKGKPWRILESEVYEYKEKKCK